MILEGQDPIGSMGRDIPLAALSDKNRLLYDYFFQNFAQVTNPPIDPIREELVMSLMNFIGPRPNLLDPKSGANQKLIEVKKQSMKMRVLRGGSFLCNDSYCSGYRVSRRMSSSQDSGLSHTGFRCVRDI